MSTFSLNIYLMNSRKVPYPNSWSLKFSDHKHQGFLSNWIISNYIMMALSTNRLSHVCYLSNISHYFFVAQVNTNITSFPRKATDQASLRMDRRKLCCFTIIAFSLSVINIFTWIDHTYLTHNISRLSRLLFYSVMQCKSKHNTTQMANWCHVSTTNDNF